MMMFQQMEYADLSTDILDQFDIAESLINGLDNNFYNQIITDNNKVLETMMFQQELFY